MEKLKLVFTLFATEVLGVDKQQVLSLFIFGLVLKAIKPDKEEKLNEYLSNIVSGKGSSVSPTLKGLNEEQNSEAKGSVSFYHLLIRVNESKSEKGTKMLLSKILNENELALIIYMWIVRNHPVKEGSNYSQFYKGDTKICETHGKMKILCE